MVKPSKSLTRALSRQISKVSMGHQDLHALDLNELVENRETTFILMNERLPEYFDNIEQFQRYGYVHGTNVKPIIYEEIIFIIKNYPAWERPYVPVEMENSFRDLCQTARGFLKKRQPIPCFLIAKLIKLRAAFLIYEDVYVDSGNIDETGSLMSDMSECSSTSNLSYEEVSVLNPSSADKTLEEAQDTRFKAELDYLQDFETINSMFHASSVMIQGFIATLQKSRIDREKATGFSVDDIISKMPEELQSRMQPKKMKVPWVLRYCKSQLKRSKSVATAKLATKSNLNIQPNVSYKLIYFILTGFYDSLVINCLAKIGILLTSIMAVGDAQPTPPNIDDSEENLPSATDSRSVEITTGYAVIRSYDSGHSTSQGKKPVYISKYHEIKEGLVQCFWREAEHYCEGKSPDSRNIIWMMVPHLEWTNTLDRLFGTIDYEHAKRIFLTVAERVQKIPSLVRYHDFYLKSLQICDLGPSPETVPISRMFYYNNSVNKVPPDCLSVSCILDGLLDEVCFRTSDMSLSSDMSVNDRLRAQSNQLLTNKKMKRVYDKLLSKYKFTYMPVDPIIFLHQHLTLFGPFNDTEVHKDTFETYAANFLELSTRYYTRLKHRLHAKTVTYLKRSPPAILWRRYADIEEDFDDLAKASNVFQTWLSFCHVSQKECNDRMVINMCGLLECTEKDEAISSCNVHDYLPKPVPVGKVSSLGMIRHGSSSTQSSQWTAAWTNPYEYSCEMYDFQWQEKLPPDILLQELRNDNNAFRCVDHLYVPFLDQMIVRFHDDLDDFGLSVHTWNKSIISPIGLYDFFKHTVFDQSAWVCQLENAMSKSWPTDMSNSLPTQASSGGSSRNDSKQSKNSNINSVPSFTVDDLKVTAFNMENRRGTSGVSTLFHSTEGFKITVDRDTSVRIDPSFSLKIESEGHSFGLHADPANPLLFQFEGSNGARIIFSKPEPQGALYKDEIIVKKARIPIEKGIYEMKEITTVNFGIRSQLRRKRYMTEKILRSLLVKLLTQESYVSIESLKTVESGQLILIKSTTSMTDLRKGVELTANDMLVMKDLRMIKESSVPHFRIISSALHKKKYIIMSPIKVLLKFSNRSIKKNIYPNVNIKKKIEFTKCGGNDLPYTNANEPQTLNAAYDIRVTLLSGLQVYSFPDVENPDKHMIVQSYTANGPLNKEVSNEASRTFTRQGYVRIKYHDGTIKMVGVNGNTIVGTVPCLKPKWKKRSPRVFIENEEFQKELKLGKSIHKKVNRYQKRFIDRPGSPFWPKLNKRDRYFKTLLDNFKSSNADDFLRLTPRQILTPVNYKMQADSFKDHYCLDVCTKDSFSTINDDGELVTTYADGTKITSWFKIEQEMVIIFVNDESVGHLETDIDDYECNFLVPKTGGWISVLIYYQFEHPNYATITYGMNLETFIYLPDDMQVKVKSDGTYFANFQNRFYSDITTEHIKIYTSFCRQCYDACKTILNVKHLYDNNVNVHPHEFLLETRDNFDKHFKVDYGGNCYKNNDFKSGDIKTDCLKHHTDDMEKFYAFDRNFNGKVFWSHQMFLNRILDVQYNNKEHVKYYLDEKDTMRAYEIISYSNTHYCDRFMMSYKNADPPLLRASATKENIGQIAFITRKLFEILPEWRDVVPLYDIVRKNNITKPWELPLPENLSTDFVETETEVDLKMSTENLVAKLPRHYTEKAMEYFKWLQRKAKRFKVGLLEEVVGFTKDIGHVICECADDELNDKSKEVPDMNSIINQSIFSNAMQQFDDGNKSRGRKQWSYADSVVRMPPVPVNSIISSLYGAETFAKNITAAFQREEPLMMSLSEFSTNPRSREKHVAIRSGYREPSHFVKDIYGSVLQNKTLIEWRKPNASETSSTSSKLSTMPKKKLRSRSINKSTITTQAFDIFYLKEAPINIEACSYECCCFNENNRKSQAPQQGLLKVNSQEAPVAMKKMNSFNKTYQQVSDLKCCKRNDKTLYTECKRMNKQFNNVADVPQKHKKTTSFAESGSTLPMILKNSSSN